MTVVRAGGRRVSALQAWLLGRQLSAPMSIAAVAIVAAVLGVGLFGDPYALHVGTTAGIYAIAVIGLNLLVGYGGQITFGHNAFLALGGYASAILTTRAHLPTLPALLVGMAATLAAGAAIGFPTLRLRGHYLAMATLALGLATYALAVSAEPLTNGFTGIAGVPPLTIAGFAFNSLSRMYWLSWVLSAIAFVVVERLANSRFGRALRTTALDEDVAQSLGINPLRFKVSAFCTSAVLAAVSGSLYVHLLTFTSPEAYGLDTIVLLFVMLFVGGLGNSLGAVVGAAVLVAAPAALSFLSDYVTLVFGAALLAIVIARPRGLLAAPE